MQEYAIFFWYDTAHEQFWSGLPHVQEMIYEIRYNLSPYKTLHILQSCHISMGAY